ncbi:hypothetical protein BZA77DRAFT_315572 [Pyronema omphalodes]|nr:hypothetical protein BZA77DRAFT_315572 [Pyronema omphalodes]
MRLVVEHKDDHIRYRKLQFWSKIADLLLQATGVTLRQPQKTVRGFVVQRKEKLRSRLNGTVITEDELTQKIDEWIKHEEESEREAAQSAALVPGSAPRTLTAEQRRHEEVLAQRRLILTRVGQKRRNPEGEEEQVDGEERIAVPEENASYDEVAGTPAHARRKRRRGETQSVADPSADSVVRVSAAIASVGEQLSSGLIAAARELVAARSGTPQNRGHQPEGLEEKLEELQAEIRRDREALERHRQQMETQRARDLARMEKLRKEDQARMEKQRAEDKAANDARHEDLIARLFGKLEELKKN